MRPVRHGYVSGPAWAWLTFDLGNAAFWLTWYLAPPLVPTVLRAIGRLDDALVRRGAWTVHEWLRSHRATLPPGAAPREREIRSLRIQRAEDWVLGGGWRR